MLCNRSVRPLHIIFIIYTAQLAERYSAFDYHICFIFIQRIIMYLDFVFTKSVLKQNKKRQGHKNQGPVSSKGVRLSQLYNRRKYRPKSNFGLMSVSSQGVTYG